MGLSSTIITAQTALQTNAALSTIVGRNIAGVNAPGYSRKSGDLVTTDTGSAKVASVSRATDAALLSALTKANSDAAAAQALSDGLDKIENTVSLTNTKTTTDGTSSTTDTSPATLISGLANALQTYAASPNSAAAGQAALSSAKALAANLNSATATVQGIRAQADSDIAGSVKTINTLLTQFQAANTQVIAGTLNGSDMTDAQDARDQILQSLSSQIGITTLPAANGGMSIYTDSGVTLFEGTPRTVTFTATPTFTAGTTGGAVTVDGVPVTGASSVMPIKSGALVGLTTLRDTTTVSYQNQLDQIAQGLVDSFADKDQTGGSAPTIPGLFTAAGATVGGNPAAGLAGTLTVNPNVDPTQGGTLNRLRDGNVGDPGNASYNGNTAGAAGYSAHLTALLGSLDATRPFDATSGGSASASVLGYATSSVGWLETARQSATATSTNSAALASAAGSSLSSSTGVNLDDELSKMLDLEHSYSASAELLTTVKSMFDSLLSAVQ